MPSVSNEIIEDITDHIRRRGGTFAVWCVGTARDWRSPVMEAHEHGDQDDNFIVREAYTSASARSVRLHFVNDCGMAETPQDGIDDGKLVFTFGKSPATPSQDNDGVRRRFLGHDRQRTNS